MPRKKICPKCGYVNNPADPECRNCGISITGVKAVNYSEDELKSLEEKFSRGDAGAADNQTSGDETSGSSAEANAGRDSSLPADNATSSPSQQEKSESSADEGTFTRKTALRICPECGTENPRSRRKCSSCGADIHLVQVQYRDEGGSSAGSSASVSSRSSSISSPTGASSASAGTSQISVSGAESGSDSSGNKRLSHQESKLAAEDVRRADSNRQTSSGDASSPSVSAGTASSSASSGASVSAEDMRMVKICPHCKAEMGEKFKRCTNCGGDLRDVQPVAVEKPKVNIRPQKPKNSDVAVLCSPDGKEVLTLRRSSPVIILGREHEMASYLSECQYVSRKHCELKIYEGRVIINDGSSTNGTYVNNKKIQSMKDEQLKNGDQISLGGVWDCDGAGCFTIRYNEE